MSPVTPDQCAGPRMDPPVSLPMRARSQAAGQRRRRAHAGAAREPRRVPGVPGRPVVIRVQRPVGELGRVGLPEDDRAGFPEPGHDAGVLVGHETREHLGPPGRALAPGPAEVLDGHRHAVEGAPRAAGGQLALGEARLAEDPLGVERDERVQRRVEALAAPEQRLAELDGRERPRGEAGAEVRDPEEPELDVAHGTRPVSPRDRTSSAEGSSEGPPVSSPGAGIAPGDQEAAREELGSRAAARRRSIFDGRPATRDRSAGRVAHRAAVETTSTPDVWPKPHRKYS